MKSYTGGTPRFKNITIFNNNKVSKDVFMPWREKQIISINPNFQAQKWKERLHKKIILESASRHELLIGRSFAKTVSVWNLLQIVFPVAFMKTNLTKFALIWEKKAQKAGFLRPISSKVILVKERARRKKGREEIQQWKHS